MNKNNHLTQTPLIGQFEVHNCTDRGKWLSPKTIVCIVILLLLQTFMANVFAGERTKEEMRMAALNTLSKSNNARGKTVTAKTSDLKEYVTMEKLSVIGSDGLGFAVVTSDDRFDEVIGYSMSRFSEEMPCGFKWWMETAEKVMENAKGQTATSRSKVRSKAAKASVEPLMTTKWGQTNPYNALLNYTINGNSYTFITGCVATAMAQVMKYHRYPEKSTGTIEYVVLNYLAKMSHDFGATYDYDKMLDEYNYQIWGSLDANAKAVATLMQDCGMAVKMNYGTEEQGGSGAKSSEIPVGLKTYFSYSDETKLYTRSDYTKTEWMQMIYNELSAGRPIIYSGQDKTDPDNPSGHAFVLHGYNSSGLVYVNWGAKGGYDGYFDIDLLNPSNNTDTDTYSSDQDMVFAVPGNGQTIVTNQYDLSISANGSGSVYYCGNTIRSKTTTYTLDEGSSATLTFTPDDGYQIKKVTVNDVDVTSSILNNQYTITNITSNKFVMVTFDDSSGNGDPAQSGTFEINGIYYNLVNKTKEAEVTKGNWSDIPNYGDGRYSNEIGIPESVEYEGVTYNVTSIGNKAFYFCRDLTSVTIPNSVTSIGEGAFAICTGLTSVVIPNSVTTICNSAFQNCTSLASVVIPNSVTSIGGWTFSGCSVLTSVNIPNSVTSIGGWTFNGCSSLTSVTIPNNVTTIGMNAFYGCSSFTSVTIPNSVTDIGGYAFEGCSGLTSVIIGNSVNSIWNKAFGSCQNLKNVYCSPEKVPFTNSDAFEGSYPESITLHVPSSAIDNYKTTAPWSSFKEVVAFSKMYTLTYKVDGEVYKTYTLEEGTSIIPETKPTREGYTFSGWSEIPETMPSHDVIVTGSFVAIPVTTYTLTISATGNGSVSYSDNSIRSKTSTYSLDEGSSATLTITPDEGYRIKSVTVNNEDATSSVLDNQYVVNNVSSDLNIAVVFEVIPVEPAIDYNLFVTCSGYSMSKTIINGSTKTTLGLEMTNSGTEDIVVTKLILKDPNSNDIISTTTDASILGELKGGTEKSFSLQINMAFENFPTCELVYTLNNREYSYIASNYRILTITANDYGYLTFSGISAGSKTKKFSLKPGDNATIGIVPAEGGVLNKLTVNKSDVTSSISNNQYIINNVTTNTSVTAIFDMNSGDVQTIDGHQYIDLGLSSGSYWSAVNYGATKPEEAGAYLSSVWSFSSQWGEHWIVPTKEDIQELIDECEWTWTEQNGQNGYSIKGPNGNTMFLPAAGEGSSAWGTSGVGTSIRYFTSSEAGYGSSYWILSGNSSEYQLKSNYIITEEYPVRPISTVKKEIPKHSLTYVVDGEVYKTYTLKVGETITPESEPTKNGYKFSGWSDIPEKMPDNDVTITGSFEKFYDVADIVSLVNFVMGISTAEEKDFSVYDLNNDKIFDIGDMVLVIKEIIRNMDSQMMARAETRTADPYVDLSRFTAAQFMLNVSAGCPIADIRLTGSNQSTHDVVWQQTDTGEYAVVIYSKNNQKLSSEKGNIIDVIFADGNCSDMSISNVVLATPEGERVWLNSLPANATPTGISGMENTETFDIYDMTGRKVRSQCHSLEGIASGVYIINGKKTVIK